MRAARDRHDAIPDARQEQPGEGEVAEVVGAELQLEAVRRRAVRRGHHAGVVDEHVDVAIEAFGEGTHRGQIGEVQRANLGVAAQPGRRGLALGGVADGEHDVRSGPG
jgi:hypothetical protein